MSLVDGVEFKVLGPLQVSAARMPVAIGTARKRRLVLAVLLARAGHVVSVDTLVAAVWGDRPPVSARNNLQLYVHQLRRVLGGGITAAPDGYLIDPGGELDSTEFQLLVSDGTRALDTGDPATAATLLGRALDLWRGRAFAEFLETDVVADEAQRLELLRVETYERWAEARLATGVARGLVAELATLCQTHPYRETLRGHLMRALYQTGRQAEALAVFRETRALLVEQLGVEPGPDLQQLHAAMLRGDQAVRPPGTDPQLSTVPRTLPADPVAFAGREPELRMLDKQLTDPAPVVICGMAGVGKTTLAVHWSHRVGERFPDGQLYIDLRGFDPDGRVVAASEAVRILLDALGVPAGRVPADLDAQLGLYRSLLAGKRVLVVLDNARDVAQVRDLLPGSPTVRVVVTSRDRLTGLVAAHGAHPLRLDLPTPAEARRLLARRLGADRVWRRSTRLSTPAPGYRWRWRSRPPVPSRPGSRSQRSPPSSPSPVTGWTRSMPATRPVRSGPCSRGRTPR